jgi:hypothetical protein
MTGNQDLHRRLASYYDSEPPLRAPGWVLQAALSTVETTPQRRGPAALRRYSPLSTYMKLATAAVVVIAAAGFAVWQMAPRGGGGPSVPTPSPISTPNPSPAPTQAIVTPAPEPTTYVVPPLTGTFTSSQYGFTLSYPQGWAASPATEVWRTSALPDYGNPAVDTVSDVELRDHLFVGAGSQLLNGTTLVDWQTGFLTAEECGATDPIVVDGANGVIGRNCDIALVEAGGRGYIFGLWSSGDDQQLHDLDTRGLFQEMLATVQLQPDAALN